MCCEAGNVYFEYFIQVLSFVVELFSCYYWCDGMSVIIENGHGYNYKKNSLTRFEGFLTL